MNGSCSCGQIKFSLQSDPMIVHCCHCTWCQRETGSAFVINAVIESDRVHRNSGATEEILSPSASGKGQRIHRCPRCKVAVWSHYPSGGQEVCFVRVGTLDQARHIRPDIHIYTSTKQVWVNLDDEKRVYPEFYDPSVEWSADMRSRWATVKGLKK